ncbi:MAG TPA: CYTH domain-containing protein [Streptosporangiaceae bacterium]|nr:CYTH domain-containing protein [Streptosporangiaceae bacterium]
MSDRPIEHLETEQKFDVSPDFVVPDLSRVVDASGVTEPEVRLLTARYFDTADLRLAGARITLRRRTGGTDAGWHLKLPKSAGTRREMREPLGDSETAVPAQLRSLVSEQVADEPLQVVAVLETRRTVRNITAPDGTILAEVADDLVSGRVPGREPDTWREIEVELVSGGPEVLAAARSRLTAAGARISDSPSKLSRVLSRSS